MLASRRAMLRCAAPQSAAVRLPAARLQRVVLRAAAVDLKPTKQEAEVKEVETFEDLDYPEILPTTQQVQGFLKTLVAETEIAEIHLQVGTFELKVKRSMLTGGAAAPVAPAPAAPLPSMTLPLLDLPATSMMSVDMSALEASVDESLIYVTSPKVGILRRGRYAAGKRVGKGNVVNEGDQVKMGQTLAFVEQLGTYVPVEAPQAGELVRFEAQEGGAVEYGQLVVELAPYFGGHIIGDKKHA